MISGTTSFQSGQDQPSPLLVGVCSGTISPSTEKDDAFFFAPPSPKRRAVLTPPSFFPTLPLESAPHFRVLCLGLGRRRHLPPLADIDSYMIKLQEF